MPQQAKAGRVHKGMSWYAASAVFVYRVREGKQSRFPVLENVYLIEADSDEDALKKAEELGKSRSIDDETMTLDGRPARLDYAGIRKLLTIENPFPAQPNTDQPGHGTEVTYSDFTVANEKDLKRLVGGKSVSYQPTELVTRVGDSQSRADVIL